MLLLSHNTTNSELCRSMLLILQTEQPCVARAVALTINVLQSAERPAARVYSLPVV